MSPYLETCGDHEVTTKGHPSGAPQRGAARLGRPAPWQEGPKGHQKQRAPWTRTAVRMRARGGTDCGAPAQVVPAAVSGGGLEMQHPQRAHQAAAGHRHGIRTTRAPLPTAHGTMYQSKDN